MQTAYYDSEDAFQILHNNDNKPLITFSLNFLTLIGV